MVLPKAHRTRREKPSGWIYVRWTAWRGKGAPAIGSYKGRSDAEVEDLERADAPELARKYADAHGGPVVETTMLAHLFDLYEDSHAFKKCAESTKKHRSRAIALMKSDVDPKSKKLFASLPIAALKYPATKRVFTRWRDTIGANNGPRAADERIETARTALSWAMKNAHAPANPCLGIERLSHSDRGDLIWEEEHNALFFGYIREEIARISRETNWESEHARRRAREQIIRLAAARDTVILAQNTGMRRENLSTHKWTELQWPAIAYTALKGARRARTANKPSDITVLPILPAAAAVYRRRWEATGRTSPWIITSARGSRYVPDALGANVYEITALLGIERTLHDCKGNFVTFLAATGKFSNAEVAKMVDWSEKDVERILKKYLSAPAMAASMLARIKAGASG